ncbi:MAG: peroxiredoxin family protein [Gemmatimonadaceae bacterium]
MKVSSGVARFLFASALCSPAMLLSQAAPAPPTGPLPGANGPNVGTVAPDFSLPGATRYGRLQNPVKLSDFRGQTVVLAFFFQARTKG